METRYKPVRATQEMRGHSYAELLFARNLESSVQGFAQIIKGEKKGRNARKFFTQLAAEVEEKEIATLPESEIRGMLNAFIAKHLPEQSEPGDEE